MGLYHKYRPDSFAAMVGQKAAVKVLTGYAGKYPKALLFVGPSGVGKCLGKGTPVLMYDGTVKAVEDVGIGDYLMGPDSRPRRVKSLARGREAMYRVVPVKGEPYVVNESHILSLKLPIWKVGAGHRVENVSVREYLSWSSAKRAVARGWRTGVDFPSRPVPVDPYYLGIWLADGSADTANRVHKPDREVYEFLVEYAARLGLSVRNSVANPNRCPCWTLTSGNQGGKRNPLTELVESLGVVGNKHVPHSYLANSREVRLQLLAGLLDGDGSRTKGGYDYSSTREVLADAVCFLARSLGLAAYKKSRTTTCQTGASCLSYRVGISGYCDTIPCRIARKKSTPRRQTKDVLVTGITIESMGQGDYYGFELEGDGLFLLGDFTVTHNTTAARIVATDLDCEPPDLVEKNCAAVDSAIDMVRDLQGQMYGMGMRGEKRVWILDEIQSFSRAKFAQEALLKILEDCPDHVHFVLCATDEKKLIPTIRTRCARIPFHPVSEGDLKTLVERVARAEGKSLDDDLAWKVAQSAGGSPRAALVELEKILGIVDPAGREEAIEGVRAEKVAFDIVREVLPFKGEPDFARVAKVLVDIKEEDPEGIRQMVLASARMTLLKGGPMSYRAYTLIQCLRDPYHDRNSGHALLAADLYKAVAQGGKK